MSGEPWLVARFVLALGLTALLLAWMIRFTRIRLRDWLDQPATLNHPLGLMILLAVIAGMVGRSVDWLSDIARAFRTIFTALVGPGVLLGVAMALFRQGRRLSGDST